MTTYHAISTLIQYAIQHQLMTPSDIDYAYNKLLDLLQLDDQSMPVIETDINAEPSAYLSPLLDHAVDSGLITIDTVKQRDMFAAKIMDVVIPRPSEVVRQFQQFDTPLEQTNWFYHVSQKSNYIKTARTNKNIRWTSDTPYGPIDITINLSKPEKDPKDIILQGQNAGSNDYPSCLLCKENVGYNGASTGVGRTSHRIVPVTINKEAFYLQYSPYVYYNEHCIVLHENHVPMNVTKATFVRLFDFIDQFPHYFLGSNAGLPIVGGSILSHEHYQGGHYHFPIERAKVLYQTVINDVVWEQLHWPLSVIRLRANDRNKLVEQAFKLYRFWEAYNNEALEIHSHTKSTPHNAITPIARMKDGMYELDMTLRNNRTSEDYPLGIFHPHSEHHHIKKENIGLIEVMGLAVLPGRLQEELESIKTALTDKTSLAPSLDHHNKWLGELQTRYDGNDVDAFMEHEVALKFTQVIENAGVFKQTKAGQEAFQQFIEEVEHVFR